MSKRPCGVKSHDWHFEMIENEPHYVCSRCGKIVKITASTKQHPIERGQTMKSFSENTVRATNLARIQTLRKQEKTWGEIRKILTAEGWTRPSGKALTDRYLYTLATRTTARRTKQKTQARRGPLNKGVFARKDEDCCCEDKASYIDDVYKWKLTPKTRTKIISIIVSR